MSERMRTPWATASALGLVLTLAYLLIAPPSADLAAATYRSDLLAHGSFLWDNGWYAGHALPGYSLLSPALGALLGVRLQLALSALIGSALFALLSARAFASAGAARLAGGWFAFGLCIEMLSGRVAYGLGLAIALGALLARIDNRAALAGGLAALTSLASPVAGAFLALIALAAAATTHAGASRRIDLGILVGALAPILALVLAFGEGGYEPFAPTAFWPALAGVLLIALGLSLMDGRGTPLLRALRLAAVLYALVLGVSFAIHTPLGGNTARLGSLLAGPLLAGVLWPQRRLLLALLAPALVYWQIAPSLRDVSAIWGEPSVNASYYAPLQAELAIQTGSHPSRIEVPLMGSHWEAARLVRDGISLARGWERQLDTRYASLFYEGRLTAPAYRRWLYENAVSYVALPDARLDSAGVQEAALIRSGIPFLRELWSSKHWRLYAVRRAQPLAQPPARLLSLGGESFTLRAPLPGDYEVRVRFSPYWKLASGAGCVRRAPGGWTALKLTRPGPVRVTIGFSLERIFDHGPRCS